MAAKGFQQAEVEAILKIAGDDGIWMEGNGGNEGSNNMDMYDEDF